jgi:hypothetical protein
MDQSPPAGAAGAGAPGAGAAGAGTPGAGAAGAGTPGAGAAGAGTPGAGAAGAAGTAGAAGATRGRRLEVCVRGPVVSETVDRAALRVSGKEPVMDVTVNLGE